MIFKIWCQWTSDWHHQPCSLIDTPVHYMSLDYLKLVVLKSPMRVASTVFFFQDHLSRPTRLFLAARKMEKYSWSRQMARIEHQNAVLKKWIWNCLNIFLWFSMSPCIGVGTLKLLLSNFLGRAEAGSLIICAPKKRSSAPLKTIKCAPELSHRNILLRGAPLGWRGNYHGIK